MQMAEKSWDMFICVDKWPPMYLSRLNFFPDYQAVKFLHY